MAPVLDCWLAMWPEGEAVTLEGFPPRGDAHEFGKKAGRRQRRTERYMEPRVFEKARLCSKPLDAMANSPYSPAFEQYCAVLNMRLPSSGVCTGVEQFHR